MNGSEWREALGGGAAGSSFTFARDFARFSSFTVGRPFSRLLAEHVDAMLRTFARTDSVDSVFYFSSLFLNN